MKSGHLQEKESEGTSGIDEVGSVAPLSVFLSFLVTPCSFTVLFEPSLTTSFPASRCLRAKISSTCPQNALSFADLFPVSSPILYFS